MKNVLLIILSIGTISCFDSNLRFDENFYENTTSIKFPEEYNVLETFDNGEYLTGTVFFIECLTLRNFVTENHFQLLKGNQNLRFWVEYYFIKNKPSIQKPYGHYYLQKSSDRHHWIYMADLNSERLWTEISYPDNAGN